MNRSIIYSVLLAASLLTVQCKQSETPTEELKPNILWITIEDTSPQFIGCYGNIHAKTPIIDRLADDGVRFTNAFSTGTVCSPSRTAIITGVKTYKTGSGNHRSKFPVPEFIKGFPFYLQQLGYYTTNNAKTDYNVADEDQFIKNSWDESSKNAGWWNRKKGEPFFAVFNFMESHQSRTMTESYDWYLKNVLDDLDPDEQILEDQFVMPPFYRDSPEMRRQFARVYNSVSLTDKRIGELLLRLKKENLMDSTIIFFFADHGEGMPRGKTNGINYGYRIPFIIWFPDMYKHLSPWGNGGVISDELIDFTDLAPTLISLAGGEIPGHLHGRPFLGNERAVAPERLFLSSDRSDNGIDMVRTVTDGRFVYSRNFFAFVNEVRYIRYMEIGDIKQIMRNDLSEGNLNLLQKSLFNERPPEFLFDIVNDPWETRNLAEEVEYQFILEEMRDCLRDEILSSRDILFLPEYELCLLSDSVAPYNFRLNVIKYPLDKIYDAASLSGFRGIDITEKQIHILTDENKVVRFWAALGLRSQNSVSLKPFYNELVRAMNDPYPPVAVTAAAIVYHVFGTGNSEEALKSFCVDSNNDISLMAINYLLYTENQRPFIEAIREAYAMKGRDYNVRAACMDFMGSLSLVPNNSGYRE